MTASLSATRSFLKSSQERPDRSRPRAETLGGLPLERVERRLVDRERRLVRKRANEAHLLLKELLVVGDLQHDGAEETIVRDERDRDVVERDDRPAFVE